MMLCRGLLNFDCFSIDSDLSNKKIKTNAFRKIDNHRSVSLVSEMLIWILRLRLCSSKIITGKKPTLHTHHTAAMSYFNQSLKYAPHLQFTKVIICDTYLVLKYS